MSHLYGELSISIKLSTRGGFMYRVLIPGHITQVARLHSAAISSFIVVGIAGIAIVGVLSAMAVIHG
jgi:hypothetical protein